jgi:hypothetical protein
MPAGSFDWPSASTAERLTVGSLSLSCEASFARSTFSYAAGKFARDAQQKAAIITEKNFAFKRLACMLDGPPLRESNPRGHSRSLAASEVDGIGTAVVRP